MEYLISMISGFHFWIDKVTLAILACYLVFELTFLSIQSTKDKIRGVYFSKSTAWDLISLSLLLTGTATILNNLFLMNIPAQFYLLKDSIRIELLEPVPYGLKLFIGFLLYDFLSYWRHRFFHSAEIFWINHSFHHSATRLNPLTNFRNHPLQNFFSNLIAGIPINLMIGLSLGDSLAFALVSNFIGCFQHGNIDTNLGWLGRHLIVTPCFHRLHHAKSGTYHTNFGDMLVIWDKIFNTYTPPDRSINDIEVGIEDNFFEKKSFVYAFFRPVFLFYRELFYLLLKLMRLKRQT